MVSLKRRRGRGTGTEPALIIALRQKNEELLEEIEELREERARSHQENEGLKLRIAKFEAESQAPQEVPGADEKASAVAVWGPSNMHPFRDCLCCSKPTPQAAVEVLPAAPPDPTIAAKKKRYPLLPKVAERCDKIVYQNTNKAGGLVRWSAKHKNLVPMCRQCGEKQASNEDKDGKRTLCKKCAKNAGCHQLNRPCQGCRKVEAHFTDEDGKIRFCGPCAIDLGLKPQASRGASMEACRCWHLLEDAVFTQAGWSCKLTHHVHFENGRTDPTGAEKEGLIPERKFKPDAFIEPGLPIHLPGETSGEKGAVFLYHGNPWHGFPKGHPKYEENNFRGTPNKLLFEKTVQQHVLYKAQGYRVFFVWEHDIMTAMRKTCPGSIRDVVREYLPPSTASPRPVLKQSKLSFARSK